MLRDCGASACEAIEEAGAGRLKSVGRLTAQKRASLHLPSVPTPCRLVRIATQTKKADRQASELLFAEPWSRNSPSARWKQLRRSERPLRTSKSADRAETR